MRKGIDAQGGEPCTPARANDALIGGKKKTKTSKRKKQGAGAELVYPRLVTSYEPHGSYGGSILKPPTPQGEYLIHILLICIKH